MSTVEIDLNVRVRNNETFSAFRHIHGSVPARGDVVDVVEPECGLGGKAIVTEVDHTKGIVYLAVEWANLYQVGTPQDSPAATVRLFGGGLAATTTGVTYGSGSTYTIGPTQRYLPTTDPELTPA